MNFPFNYYAVAAFINSVVAAAFAILVILKNPRNPKNIGFSMFAGFVSLWNIFYFFWQNVTDNPAEALFWCRALMMPVIFIPVSYLYLTLTLTEVIKERKKTMIFAWAISFLFFLSGFTPYFIDHVEPVAGVKYWPIATPVSTAYWIWFSSCVAYCFYLIIKKYLISTGVQKLQLRYVIAGLVIAFISGYFDIMPWFKIPIPPIPHILVSAYVILTGYSISRYRLMDIRMIARNIFFYMGFATSLFIIFYLVAFLHLFLFGGLLTLGGLLFSLFLAPVIAIILYVGNEFLSNFLNKYIFHSLYDYQQAIKQASQKLGYYATLEEIADIVIKTIKGTLHSDSVALLAASGKEGVWHFEVAGASGFVESAISSLDYNMFSAYFKQKQSAIAKDELGDLMQDAKNKDLKDSLTAIGEAMQRYNIAIVSPLMKSDALSGLIIIGEKEDNDSYNKEDFILLETLSHQAQIAVDNTLLYLEVSEKNKSLQEALLAKDDFIRVASHQLNTPLSVMRYAFSMLKDKTITTSEGMEYLSNGLERMRGVVSGIWDVLKSEGGIKFEKEKTDISSMVDRAVEDEKAALLKMKKKIKVSVEAPGFPVPPVFCSSKQIDDVVHNLLENAIFYTEKGSVTVSYELVKNNEYLKVNIKDTGVGFSAEDKAKIGQKFYRTKRAMLLHPDSSGLGVYICKKTVEDNKGELAYESEGEGKGSTFSFTLPVWRG